ncbi:hypothetical protein LTR22_020531 [Elasticomyces elasticus]|nr:hypothetical protein LTR22_020531 [Elasticomyces elasticus]KAK4914960.1 hypothetical protein LTR49_016825 [Elasticomyces elasticus]
MDVKKDAVVVHTLSLPSSSSSTLGKHKGDLQQTAGTESSKQRKSSGPINTSTVAKGKEFLAFAGGCIRTYVMDMPTRHKALSNDGAFAHYVVEPWYEWFGRNSRITTSSALSSITLRPCCGQEEPSMINGGSFNYVGTYGMCPDWFVLLDQKSHSSMTTAGYLANAGGRKKFAHNDMLELERLLDEVEDRLDGDMPDLAALSKLKTRYGFVLLCDEAHSFLSLGTTGRGCVEWWNDMHPTNRVPSDLIDVCTTTLSKAVGGVGGIVCATERFNPALSARASELRATGESLATTTIIQALWILRQPRRLESSLVRLRAMSQHCHRKLERAGVFVYGETTSPILPIHAGRPTKASKLSYVCECPYSRH